MGAWTTADVEAARKWAQKYVPESHEEYCNGIVKFCKISAPSDRVCLDSRMDDKLYEIWKNRSVIPDGVSHLEENAGMYGIPADIIFANTIPIRDCEIWVDERDQIPNGIVCKYRVVIFDYLDSTLKLVKKFEEEGVFEKPEPFMVGAAIIDLQQAQLYLPLLVEYGNDFLLLGAPFVLRNGQYIDARTAFGADTINTSYFATLGNQHLLTWYSIQISLLHPKIKYGYRIEDPQIKNAKKKKSKQTKRRTKLIRRLYLDEAILDRETKGDGINRKTLVWYVCGHFRHYKNGKIIFIQPYWKGALREIKRNLDDGRDREIAI